MSLLSATVTLILLMDPLGGIPLFLGALRHVPDHRWRKVILRELLFALAILLFFLFAGRFLLDVLHLSNASLRTGGGAILLMIAIRMIFSTDDNPRAVIADEPFIVPLATPLVAGPSAMAFEMLLMSTEPDRWPVWLAAVVLAWLASSLVLGAATDVRRVIGDRGIAAMEKLMGMMLVFMAVQMLFDGIREFMQS